MKKLIVGIIAGLILGVSGTAVAANTNWVANLGRQGDNTVTKFKDGDVTCYVAKGRVTESINFAGHGYAISCLKN